MKIMLNQGEINRRKNRWQAVRHQMNVHKVTPQEVAHQTPYSKELVEKGIGGEDVPITSPFLYACVKIFGLEDARAEPNKETDYIYPDYELEALLKPPPEMPPRQGNFWEWDD